MKIRVGETTVEELIQKLQQFPAKAKVMLNDESDDGDTYYIQRLDLVENTLFIDFDSTDE
ncbi:hypothetical protein BCD64_11970 [Nostoc sp. MBR 210]|nr:hypothetical protein BCD64_11970 [Nostoc sp. MBR 210]